MNSKYRCPGCKDYFDQSQKVRLGVKYFHSLECGLKWSAAEGKKKAEKARVYRINQRKHKTPEQRKQQRIENENSLDHQIKLTQTAFNKMIKLLDADQPCISCGKMQCGYNDDAGHYHSVASTPELRFDARNCHKQGAGCNRVNHKANYKRRINTDVVNAGYQQGIVKRYGKAYLDWLDGPHEAKQYRLHEVKALKDLFNKESKRLEKGEPPSRDWRALKPATEPAKPKQLPEPKACT